MAKFLKLSGGLITEEQTVGTSAGAGDAGKVAHLDSNGRFDSTMMPVGYGEDIGVFTAGENLTAGDLVYVSAAGTVWKADANAVAKSAIGFVLAGASAAASCNVYFEGTITGLTGLTAGSKYFLSASTTGGITTTAPSGSGDIVQLVGVATSTTTLSFSPNAPIVLV